MSKENKQNKALGAYLFGGILLFFYKTCTGTVAPCAFHKWETWTAKLLTEGSWGLAFLSLAHYFSTSFLAITTIGLVGDHHGALPKCITVTIDKNFMGTDFCYLLVDDLAAGSFSSPIPQSKKEARLMSTKMSVHEKVKNIDRILKRLKTLIPEQDDLNPEEKLKKAKARRERGIETSQKICLPQAIRIGDG